MRYVILTAVENGWMAEVPSLPGCITEADTREEALEAIKEAIELYILTLQDMGKEVPGDVELELAMV